MTGVQRNVRPSSILKLHSVTPPVLVGYVAPGFRGGSDCPALLSSQSGGKSNVVRTWPGESQSVRRKVGEGEHRHGGGP